MHSAVFAPIVLELEEQRADEIRNEKQVKEIRAARRLMVGRDNKERERFKARRRLIEQLVREHQS